MSTPPFFSFFDDGFSPPPRPGQRPASSSPALSLGQLDHRSRARGTDAPRHAIVSIWKSEIRAPLIALLSGRPIGDCVALFRSVYSVTSSGDDACELLYAALKRLFQRRRHVSDDDDMVMIAGPLCGYQDDDEQWHNKNTRNDSDDDDDHDEDDEDEYENDDEEVTLSGVQLGLQKACPAAATLHEYLRRWTSYFKGAVALDGPFNYFNVHWIAQRQSQNDSLDQVNLCAAFLPALHSQPKVYHTVGQLALHCWKRHVLGALRATFTDALLDAVAFARNGALSQAFTLRDDDDDDQVRSLVDDDDGDDDEIGSEQAALQTMLEQVTKSLIDVNTPEKDIRSLDSFRHVPAHLAPPPVRLLAASDQLGDYRTLFFEPLLQANRDFYQRLSQRLSGAAVEQLLRTCQRAMRYEKQHSERILHASSVAAYRTQAARFVVAPHVQRLLAELPALLDAERFDQLAALHGLCVLLPHAEAVAAVAGAFQSFVVAKGRALLLQRCTPDAQGRLDAAQCTAELLRFHAYCTQFAARAFYAHQSFVGAVDAAFQLLLGDAAVFDPGQPHNNPAELLARFADLLLRGQAKPIVVTATSADDDDDDDDDDEAALATGVKSVALLFNYLSDKDTFQAAFSKHLARRLIQQLSVSHAAEQALLAELQDACSFDFVSSAQKMFADVAAAADLNHKFADWLKQNPPPLGHVNNGDGEHSEHQLRAQQRLLGLEFDVLLLTFGSWPIKSGPALRLPEQLDRCVSLFNAFYGALSNQGKRLTWLHHLSYGVLATAYTDRRYMIKLTDFQLSVLLLFNGHDVLTMEQLCQLTELAPPVCKQTLFSLVFTKLLRKNPPSRTFSMSDQYALNTKFQNKKINLDATKVLGRDASKDDAASRQSVLEARRNWAQALIVRLVKAQKSELSREQIVQQVLDYPRSKLTFTPTQSFVAACVDDLVATGLIERIEGKPDCFRYVSE